MADTGNVLDMIANPKVAKGLSSDNHIIRLVVFGR
jgi:hypothetical protein